VSQNLIAENLREAERLVAEARGHKEFSVLSGEVRQDCARAAASLANALRFFPTVEVEGGPAEERPRAGRKKP
jgi:hypothetical protein